MSKRLVILFGLVIVVLVLAACRQNGSQDPIKIGAIFDLTGSTAEVGSIYANGIKGYVEYINTQEGINGRPIELISQDYAFKVELAEQLYSQFVTQDKVVAFMGWGTGDTEALRGRAAADQVPFMSASYSINLVDPQTAPYNFLVGTSYSDQIIIALNWVKQDAAAKGVQAHVVVFHNDSPFGQSPVPDGKRYADANGLGYISITMPRGATDLTPQLTEAQEFKANYVIIQNTSSPAALLLKNAKALGMTGAVQFICLNWCADEYFVRLAGEAAEGVIGVLPFTADMSVPAALEAAQFLKTKGGSLAEQGLHYTQGWATMAVMVEGIRRTLDAGQALTGANIRASLENMQNFDTGGITAPITFTPSDHRGSDAVKIHQVQAGVWTPISDYIHSRITP